MAVLLVLLGICVAAMRWRRRRSSHVTLALQPSESVRRLSLSPSEEQMRQWFESTPTLPVHMEEGTEPDVAGPVQLGAGDPPEATDDGRTMVFTKQDASTRIGITLEGFDYDNSHHLLLLKDL